MGQEYGEGQKEILTLGSGKMAKLMAMVYIHGSMATDMKVSSRIV